MHKFYEKILEIENKRSFKIILFIVIIFSLLPLFKYLNQKSKSILTYIFFSIFLLESIVRFILLLWSIQAHFRGKYIRAGGVKSLIADAVFWIIDMLATISFLEFLPFGESFRVLRLLRLIKLSRYLGSFFGELGQIINRRSIRRQFIIVFLLLFAISIVVGLIFYVAEEENIIEYAWWSFKTLFDPGEMIGYEEFYNDVGGDENDTDLKTLPIKTVFSISLTIVGLLLLSFFIGIGTQVVENLVQITKNKKLSYKNHIIIYGWSRGTELMLSEVLKVLEDNQINDKIVLLQDVDETLEDDIELKYKNIVSRYHLHNTSEALRKVGIEKAHTIIVFGRSNINKNDDPDVIKKILTIREIYNPELYVIGMIKSEKNHAPAIEVGADIVIIRESFMGFYMTQNILKPELKKFYYEVLTSEGCEFYTQKIKGTLLNNYSDKPISYVDLYMRLLENECTLVGFIRKKNTENDNDIYNTIGNERFIVNPMQYYDTETNMLASSTYFYPKDIESIVCLSDNGIALYNSMQEINYQTAIIKNETKSLIDFNKPKTKNMNYEKIKKKDLNKTLIFGWNDTIPAMIQQLSTYFNFNHDILIFLHHDYNYTEEDIELMRKKIKEQLLLYYSNYGLINKIIKSIVFKIGDYYSRYDLFSKDIGNLRQKDIVVVVPDNKTADNPDADVFLMLLTILGIIKDYRTGSVLPSFENIRIYAQVSNDRVGKKLDEILEKVNIKTTRENVSVNEQNIIDRFNIVYSEKILNYLLVQHLTNRYAKMIFNAIMTNDDMNSVIVLSPDFIKDVPELRDSITGKGVVIYDSICKYLLQNHITPIGYDFSDHRGIHMCINPSLEERYIDLESIINIIVIGNYENEIIKKYDRNK